MEVGGAIAKGRTYSCAMSFVECRTSNYLLLFKLLDQKISYLHLHGKMRTGIIT